MANQSDSNESTSTKQRIISCAESIFSDKGFRKATVSEICDAADANIAAVNYHFGNKSKLYEAVLLHSFKKAQEQFPVHGNLSGDVSPEARLETFIRALLLRAFCQSPAGAFSKFMVHEMTNPTSLLESVMMNLMFNEIKELKNILQSILPENIAENRRRFFGFNIMAMVMFFSFNKPAREKMMTGRKLTPDQVNRLIRHMTLFVLGGLNSATQSLDEPIDGLLDYSDVDCCEKHRTEDQS